MQRHASARDGASGLAIPLQSADGRASGDGYGPCPGMISAQGESGSRAAGRSPRRWRSDLAVTRHDRSLARDWFSHIVTGACPNENAAEGLAQPIWSCALAATWNRSFLRSCDLTGRRLRSSPDGGRVRHRDGDYGVVPASRDRCQLRACRCALASLLTIRS